MEKIKELNICKIVLVGRTNVGKSSLFNRLSEQRTALVAPWPGVTKERNKELIIWKGEYFLLIDTPGIETNDPEILKQIQKGIEEADIILNVVDGREQISTKEIDFAKKILKTKKPVLLAINKVDGRNIEKTIQEKNFKILGIKDSFLVSAVTGRELGDLLDKIFELAEKLKKIKETDYNINPKPPKITIFGRTNVGKSSILNQILAQQRAIVKQSAHTTREPEKTWITFNKNTFLLIDTPGIRKRAKTKSKVEFEGILKTKKIIEKSDILILVIDCQEMLHRQDKKLLGIIKQSNKPSLIILNKVDTIKNLPNKQDFYSYWQNALFKFKQDKIFVSAKTGENIDKVVSWLKNVLKNF